MVVGEEETEDPEKSLKQRLIKWVGQEINTHGKVRSWEKVKTAVRTSYSAYTLRGWIRSLTAEFTSSQLRARYDVVEADVATLYRTYKNARQ